MERIEETALRITRLWRSPSVRNLTLSLIILSLLAVCFIALYSHYSTEKLKKDWLNKEAAMIGSLSSAQPELAEQWMDQLTKSGPPSPDDTAQGREIMERYGITDLLKSDWLPLLRDYQSRTFWSLISGALVIITLFALLLFREIRRQLREIRHLAVAMEDTVKHNQPMSFRLYDEGELGLLANGAQELTIRLRETIEQLHQDKTFLKDTVSDISHQLKTPLASLMIYMDLLSSGQVDSVHAAEFMETCRRELDRMEWLILTLLKLARIEADALEMSYKRVPLADTVDQAVDSVQPLANNKQIRFQFEESYRGLVIPHDPHWLMEALANLLKNAVEHSPIGSTVTIGWESTPVFVRIYIRDQGHGIEAEHLPHIFKKFYRTSTDGSGVGLGLPLAKSIVEKHGGVISAAANSTGGTVFYISLPHRPFPAELTNL